jgi:predicted ABC-type ATPase
MSELIVVTGPPGAGKSTVAEALVTGFTPSALVPGDDFFGFLRAGRIDPWLPESQAQNEAITRAAAAAAGRLTAGGYVVVFDGMVGPWFLPTFADAAGAVRLHYAVLMPSEQCCRNRVATRRDHGFTDLAATSHMYQQFAQAQIEERHRFDNSMDEPVQTAASIRARMTIGALTYRP